MSRDTKQTATQRASAELAEVVFGDPELRDRFVLMAKETEKRLPTPDDFAWLPREDRRTVPEFSRFKALTRRLLGVSKSKVTAAVHRR